MGWAVPFLLIYVFMGCTRITLTLPLTLNPLYTCHLFELQKFIKWHNTPWHPNWQWATSPYCLWSSEYDSSSTACWLQLYIPYKTCGLRSASVQHKHSSKHEASRRTPKPVKMCQVSCYQTRPPLPFYVTAYRGDLVAQSHDTLASKSVPK